MVFSNFENESCDWYAWPALPTVYWHTGTGTGTGMRIPTEKNSCRWNIIATTMEKKEPTIVFLPDDMGIAYLDDHPICTLPGCKHHEMCGIPHLEDEDQAIIDLVNDAQHQLQSQEKCGYVQSTFTRMKVVSHNQTGYRDIPNLFNQQVEDLESQAKHDVNHEDISWKAMDRQMSKLEFQLRLNQQVCSELYLKTNGVRQKLDVALMRTRAVALEFERKDQLNELESEFIKLRDELNQLQDELLGCRYY